MKTTFNGVIDRFEGEYAVVLIGQERDESFEMKRALLPEGSKEGDIVTVSVKISPDKTREARNRVSDMIDKLGSK